MKINYVKFFLLLAGWFFVSTCERDSWAPVDVKTAQQELEERTFCDPCEGDLILGPETFVRTNGRPVGPPFLPHGYIGKPTATHRMFSMGEEADVCITVVSSGANAAIVALDGLEIFTPANFTGVGATLQFTTHLFTGTHDLTVTMMGQPGGTITVEIRGCITTPPPPILCSEVARQDCEGRGWTVVGVFEQEGTLVCTADGRGPENNCDTCSVYNIYVWKNGAVDHFCLFDDGPFSYSTLAGQKRGGHIPCACGDSLYACGSWDMQGCVPD